MVDAGNLSWMMPPAKHNRYVLVSSHRLSLMYPHGVAVVYVDAVYNCNKSGNNKSSYTYNNAKSGNSKIVVILQYKKVTDRTVGKIVICKNRSNNSRKFASTKSGSDVLKGVVCQGRGGDHIYRIHTYIFYTIDRIYIYIYIYMCMCIYTYSICVYI